MKSMTIHISGQLAEFIKSTAKAKGISINKTIQQLLEEALGVKSQGKDSKHPTDFSEFCGLWTMEDLSEFEKETKAFQEGQPGDWK